MGLVGLLLLACLALPAAPAVAAEPAESAEPAAEGEPAESAEPVADEEPAEPAEPEEPPVSAEPAALRFAGARTPLRKLVTLEAAVEVTDLEMVGRPLRESTGRQEWIDASKIAFDPAEPRKLAAGVPEDFVVTINEVPSGVGTFEGSIRVTYKVNGEESRLALPISVTVGEPELGVLVVDPPDRSLTIGGVVGSSTFRTEFRLKATSKIDGLKITPGSLEEERLDAWISGQSITVSPASPVSFKAGEEKQFSVTVGNVAAPGVFAGRLVLSRDGVAETEELELEVDAIKLDPPTALEVRFVNQGWFGLGGTATAGQSFELYPAVERSSSTVMRDLLSTLDARLGRLEHGARKELELALEPAQPALAPRSANGEPTVFDLTFTRTTRDAPPGTYSGNLWLTAGRLGTVATIPVTVKVRGSAWLAWLLLVGGLLSSWMITYWHTTGSKKNDLRGQLAKLQRRLENSPLTDAGRQQVRLEIAKAFDLMAANKLTEAQTQVTKADTALTTAIGVKRDLQAKAAEVEAMLAPIQRLEESLKAALGSAAAAAPVLIYLESIRRRVKTLQGRIQEGVYAKADNPQLKAELDEAAKETRELEAVVENHRRVREQVDLTAATFAQAFPGKKPIAKELERNHLRDLTEKLGQICHGDAVKSLGELITQSAATVGQVDDVIRRLRTFAEILRDMSAPPPAAETEIDSLIGKLRVRAVPQTTEVEKVAELIRQAWQASAGTDADPDEKLQPDLAATTVQLAGAEEMMLEAVLAFPGADEPVEGTWGQLKKLWQPVRRWFTPERTGLVVKLLLYAITLGILVPIGISQTYYKSDTFGDAKAGIDYLAVFLWGFGIQATAATAGGVLDKIVKGS